MNKHFRRQRCWLTMLLASAMLFSSQAAQAGYLSGTFALAPNSTIDLTAQGTLDWAYWEGTSLAKFDRRSTSVTPLGALTAIGSPTLFDFGGSVGTAYSWTNGLNIPSTTRDGLVQAFPGLVGEGFSLTAPADQTMRRLRFYVGAAAATGQITATLGDSSAPVEIKSIVQGVGDTFVYDVFYQANSPGQQLTVNYTKTAQTAGSPNVFVSAATLSAVPLGIRNASLEAPGATASFPQADDWQGSAPTALHSSFPHGNSAGLGSSFGFVQPNLPIASQTLADLFQPNMKYVFTGFGVDNNINNENDLALRIGYLNDAGVFQLLAEQIFDLTGKNNWTLLDGVTYVTGGSGPELGRLLTLQVRGVNVDNPGGGVFFDALSLTIIQVPEAKTLAVWSVASIAALMAIAIRRRRHVS
jgi:hypothetical protein